MQEELEGPHLQRVAALEAEAEKVGGGAAGGPRRTDGRTEGGRAVCLCAVPAIIFCAEEGAREPQGRDHAGRRRPGTEQASERARVCCEADIQRGLSAARVWLQAKELETVLAEREAEVAALKRHAQRLQVGRAGTRHHSTEAMGCGLKMDGCTGGPPYVRGGQERLEDKKEAEEVRRLTRVAAAAELQTRITQETLKEVSQPVSRAAGRQAVGDGWMEWVGRLAAAAGASGQGPRGVGGAPGVAAAAEGAGRGAGEGREAGGRAGRAGEEEGQHRGGRGQGGGRGPHRQGPGTGRSTG